MLLNVYLGFPTLLFLVSNIFGIVSFTTCRHKQTGHVQVFLATLSYMHIWNQRRAYLEAFTDFWLFFWPFFLMGTELLFSVPVCVN
jgi:hypothetical protein